jgi:HK97 gp10 family phage protein
MATAITGLENILKNIERAKVAAQKGAEKGVERARLAVETTAKKLIQRGPKTGIMYGKHRASAPGEPPATDTGTLVNSIESKRDGLVAVVWTEKKYGKYLEFGTRNIAPRPWLTPAVEQNRARFPLELGNAVIESIDGAVKK